MPEPIVDLPGELWKPIVGYEGLYEVSNKGRVKSLGRPAPSKMTSALYQYQPRVMRPTLDEQGRPRVQLSAGDHQRRMVFVHKLVLTAFVGPRPAGLMCCHYNDDSTDNRLANLRWDTPEANYRDAVRNGKLPGARYTGRAVCGIAVGVQEKAAIVAAASAEGRTISEWGRLALLEKLERGT